MNIPYEQIIANANERKLALERYQEAMEDVAGRFDDATMQENFAALSDLKKAIYALDPEARTLIGSDKLVAFSGWLASVELAWARLQQRGTAEQLTAAAAFNELMGRKVL